MIGLALTACGGHREHENDHDGDDKKNADTTVTAKPAESKEDNDEKEEHKEHTPKHEDHTEAPKDTVAVKGAPVVTKTDAEKPKDASTMGTQAKHHVKPGGVQGTK